MNILDFKPGDRFTTPDGTMLVTDAIPGVDEMFTVVNIETGTTWIVHVDEELVLTTNDPTTCTCHPIAGPDSDGKYYHHEDCGWFNANGIVDLSIPVNTDRPTDQELSEMAEEQAYYDSIENGVLYVEPYTSTMGDI